MTSFVATNHATGAGSAEIRGEFSAVVAGCGVYDLEGRAQISIAGGDRVRWLNGMVTNNVRDLQPGHGVYAFLLNPQGHILGDLSIYNREKSLLAETDRSQLEKVMATFDRYIIMDDVELEDLAETRQATGVVGPKSRQVLQGAGLEIPILAALEFVDVKWRDASVSVARGDNGSVETYEVWSAAEQADAVRDALLAAGGTPVHAATLELLRVASGIPRYGQDIRERDLPQETEQQRALHFSKGCYVGQEIVERIRSRGAVHRTFTGFTVKGPLPASGTKIQQEGRDVGEITSSASLPLASGELPAALGYLRREFATAGKTFRTNDAELTVTAVPFAEVFGHQG